MYRSRLTKDELKLEAERHLKYRGIACVRLENLHFPSEDSRELNQENVERLKELFQKDITRRLDPKNRIAAEINEIDLNEAIRTSNTSAELLMNIHDENPPFLIFPSNYQLTCLHGRHRILAAREILPPANAWWTVDLYLTDTNPEARRTLIEEYSNEKKPSDGEIYRKVRQYEREDGELTAAFDKLLDIPGLWSGMRISTLHKLLDMKCYEEALHYLEHIRQFWHSLFRGDKNALRRVNNVDVKSLELKAPKYSKQDAQILQVQLLSGQIFSAFSQKEREAIWSELQSIEYLTPSLFTFFEDLKYLNACAGSLKRLVKLSCRDTVFSAFQQNFHFTNESNDQYAIEIAESTFIDKSIPARHCFDTGYRQLWAFVMRNYKEIAPNTKKKKKDLLAKSGVEKADEMILFEFAALADRLGFASPEIQTLRQSSSDREIALHALLKARKPDRYQYDDITLASNVTQIMRLFSTASVISHDNISPALISDNINSSGNRCGFPDQDAHRQDRKALSLPYLNNENFETNRVTPNLRRTPARLGNNSAQSSAKLATTSNDRTKQGNLLRVWLGSPWCDYQSVTPITAKGCLLACRKGDYFEKVTIGVYEGDDTLQFLQALSVIQHANISKIRS
ncbi:f68f9563-ded7-4069-bc2f-2a3b06713e93 [Sclerotinia trifoliorum]|uniref:F68f9563-ded7-4069-bc2f-2a3b06713e93 n=1 Tax=Sclerotinia trifoliorum TaxID=28548 RepID=A0A8H2VWV8_9HELO|nr:f68f9563-ded7-4069-bc2f-2a3b06713e93 [Sclerotinia trifoliorum]